MSTAQYVALRILMRLRSGAADSLPTSVMRTSPLASTTWTGLLQQAGLPERTTNTSTNAQVHAKDSRCAAQLHAGQISARPQPMAPQPSQGHWRLMSGCSSPGNGLRSTASNMSCGWQATCIAVAAWKKRALEVVSCVTRWGKWSSNVQQRGETRVGSDPGNDRDL